MQTFTGIEYLKIDVASNFGLDKEDWNVRIDWFDAHASELEQLLPAAEEPGLYYAGIQAYKKAVRGEASGYPISLDATASGLQLLACLSGCEKSAMLCNLVSTGHRVDAYTALYGAMQKKPGVGQGITRKDLKDAIMPSLYASKAAPKRVFGEGEQLAAFYQTMEEEAPGAWELNQALQGLWQPYAPSHDWALPDNFHVHKPVTDKIGRFVQFLGQPVEVELNVNQGTREGKSISPDSIHSIDALVVREMQRRCDYDKTKTERISELLEDVGTREVAQPSSLLPRLLDLHDASGFLSARILDHIDERSVRVLNHEQRSSVSRLIDSLPNKPFQLLSNHDCFRCLPNYGNDLRRQYNQILSEIARSDMLAFIASQITGNQVAITKYGDIADRILEADYTLC